MTPDQIDTVTDGLITTWQLVGEYGPGLFAAAIAGGCWIAARRIRERRAHRRAMKVRLQRAQRALALDPADTRPGTDDQALADCWNAWNATQDRKEKPQS
ncbi:hypothetical protein ACFYY9_26255 [Streptomyces nigra]|uniref:hypothetical protein n=1 Tax=Streptomyces nigra TaxID=1827580 RepID=UPI003695FE6B